MVKGKLQTRRSRALLPASLLTLLATFAASTPAAQATTCKTSPWNELEVAHEIIDIGTVDREPEKALRTYKSAGDNPIRTRCGTPATSRRSRTSPTPTRNLQFNESRFIASPGEPVCETAYVETSDGCSWAAMSLAINAMWPYDKRAYQGLPSRNTYYAGNLVTTPPPGVVKVTANFKGQNMKFWANENGAAPGTPGAKPLQRYFVRDEWGNEYIMHASGKDTPEEVEQAFDAAVLPPGWTKSKRTLSEDLILNPAEGSDGSFHYLVFRDSADDTYHQMGWSDRGSLQAQVDGSAMPIWGGQDANVLAGGRGDDIICAGARSARPSSTPSGCSSRTAT